MQIEIWDDMNRYSQEELRSPTIFPREQDYEDKELFQEDFKLAQEREEKHSHFMDVENKLSISEQDVDSDSLIGGIESENYEFANENKLDELPMTKQSLQTATKNYIEDEDEELLNDEDEEVVIDMDNPEIVTDIDDGDIPQDEKIIDLDKE